MHLFLIKISSLCLLFVRPCQDISNQAIDEIYCIYKHKDWKNELEYWNFKCLDRAQVFGKFNFKVIWIFPLSKISSVIGGNYQKMYFHDPRLLYVYTDGNTISTEVSNIFFIHEIIFDEDIIFCDILTNYKKVFCF